ncbi:AlpA family phage regulatory protein [Rhodanobacter sp. L36]|uniref:helix-turn-helix transcriptional regulator n=1 Tax=Rhodanobacter sp. L36 TaxID=1747221 RepID=UPI00131EB2C1|nr:AlpA family phage regulatory protein [Rhodanobacter sp. L36]
MQALTLPHVTAKTGQGKSAIYDGIKNGSFPAPAKAGRRSIWSEAEIDEWLAARFAERDTKAAA